MNSYKNKKKVIKIAVDDKEMTIRISLKNLKWLFEHSPDNCGSNMEPVRVQRGKEFEFAKFVAEKFDDESAYNENNTILGEAFETTFLEASEGAYDEFLKYPKDGK